MGFKRSGLVAPDESPRCFFMGDSERWGSEQTPQWKETILDSECPMERRGGQPAKGRRQKTGKGYVYLESYNSTLSSRMLPS